MKLLKQRQRYLLRQFAPYLLRDKKIIALAILLGIVGGAAAVLMTEYIGKAVDTLLGYRQVAQQQLQTLLGLLAGLLGITVVSQWLIQRIGNHVAYLSVARLRKDVFQHLNQLPLAFFDQASKGELTSRFTNDMDTVSVACSAVFNQLFSGITIILLSLFAMLRLSMRLTLVVLVATPIIFIANWLVARYSQRYFQTQQQLIGELSGFISERISNQKIVIAFQQEKNVQQQFEQINAQLQVYGQKAQFASSLTNPLSRFIDHLTYVAIGLTGGLLMLWGSNTVTIGVISSFTIYASQFSKPFIEFSGISTQIQTAFASLERAFALFNQPAEPPDGAHAIVLNPKRIQGTIDFKDVTFAYQKNKPLIQHFNLHVPAGTTVAIVGQTGAGKSTLVNLLLRFYEVDSGQITLDGQPITQITRDSLRKSFGMVLQDTWLTEGTIRENLTYGNPNADEQTIEAVMKKAHIYDFVQLLPNQLETKIGANGLIISEGQKQLLTIARTMLSDPPMLILDEATSSVDTLTEAKIQQAFLEMMAHRTSFVIAHRLKTIKKADQILVMEQGTIIEIGTHQELINRKNSAYRALYQAQFEP